MKYSASIYYGEKHLLTMITEKDNYNNIIEECLNKGQVWDQIHRDVLPYVINATDIYLWKSGEMQTFENVTILRGGYNLKIT